MDHVAIMKKSWGLTEKILTGEKKIESRWYKMKYAPWDKIQPDDTLYFKDSGAPVTLKAKAEKILQIFPLSPQKIQNLLDEYGGDDGIKPEQIQTFFQRFQDKNYCILIFLKEVEAIEPFEINKSGFGALSAWISIDNINTIKKHT